ncbi:MAG: HAMP domain-containing protein, partial [Candidatus Parcubacteria bacterium]|nr:HAMP domain-containing protein [Candidatus Parcubacteria bacterium]
MKKIKLTLFHKLLLVFIAIITLTAGVAGFFLFNITKEIIIEKTQNNLLIASDLKEQRINHFFEDKKSDYQVLTSLLNEDLRNYLLQLGQGSDNLIKNTSENYFTQLIKAGKFTEFFLLDKDTGKILFSTDESRIGKIESNREYFTNGKKDTYIQKFFYSEDLLEPTAVIASPILDKNQKLIAVLAGRINLEEINKMMMENNGLGASGETYLVNQFNFFISQSATAQENLVFKKTIFTQATNECLAGKSNLGFYDDYRKIPVLGLYKWLPEHQLCLIAEIDQNEAFAPIYRFRNFIIIIYLLINLGAIFILSLITKAFTKPLNELVKATKIISQGNLDYKINITTKDEAGALAESFNQMIQAIKKSSAEVKQKVKEQTQEIREKSIDIENQKKAILNILEDISAERDQVRRERDKTNTILKSIGDGVMVVDQEQKIEFLNPIAEELTSWPLKEAIGISAETVFNIFDEATMAKRQSPIDEAIKTGKIKNLSNHTVLKTKDGQIIPIADSASPVKNKDGKIMGAVLVFRDMIKERIAEEKLIRVKDALGKLNEQLDFKVELKTKELRKAFDELKSLDAMKDEFLNISAHELKTPLTSIIGLSELMLLKKQGAINTKQKKSLEIVNNESTRLLSIIKKILNITRIEAKK